MRNIIIASYNFELLRKVKQLRILLSILIIFLSSLFFLISSNSEFLSYSLIILIVIGWINEINILDEELNDNKKSYFLYMYKFYFNYFDNFYLLLNKVR